MASAEEGAALSKPQPYKVRDIRIVAKGSDVLVREYTLDPGEAIPWHRHSEVADTYYGLEGVVLVETRDPPARHEVRAGQSAKVTPPSPHHVSNPGREPCRFLLVQGVGNYDFVKADG
ncbi:MAG TPA: cupin domain-containing protein [Burkholderiales bacterium]|nr:cupin domain-containing protein [Burkholderiales bacterium]